MNRKKGWAFGGILLAAVVAVLLWPAGDPLVGAEAVAIAPPSGLPEEAATHGILVRGLTVILEERGITVVEDVEEADLLLEISDVRLEELEVTLGEEGLRGKLTATCLATDLRTGETYRLYLYVTLEDGILRVELVAKRPWQFWR